MARTCTTTLLSAKGQVEILTVAVTVVLVVVVIVDTSSTQSDAVQSRGGGGGKIDVIGFQFGGEATEDFDCQRPENLSKFKCRLTPETIVRFLTYMYTK